MKNRGFRRFVAIFVGVLLAVDFAVTIAVGDEKMLGMTLAVAGVYAIYLVLYFKREKQDKAGQKDRVKSPLIRK